MPDPRTALPSPARYVQALTMLESRISDRQRELLVRHYLCPRHVATTSKLAQKIGAKNFRTINLLYGRLGTLLREELDYMGPGQKSAVVASFSRTGGPKRNEWKWFMHKEVSAALEQLGWVPRPARTAPRKQN